MSELFGLIVCLSAASKCFDTEAAKIIFTGRTKTDKKAKHVNMQKCVI
jgi:hypothetical protein